MIVAVYVCSPSKNPKSNFIVETFFPLFEELHDHQFILITDVSTEFDRLTGFEKVFIKSPPGSPLLKGFWVERTLAGVLKKVKADIFISADNFCSLKTLLPQYMLLPAPENIKAAYIRKTRLLIVVSELAKKELINKLKVGEDKIAVVYPSAGKEYLPLDADRRESIKKKYSDSKEFFLSISSSQKQQDLIDLLKSFSHFKKRQQSNFKLLILGSQNSSWEKDIENYKYRNDVLIVNPDSTREKAAITGAAYAVILPFEKEEDIAHGINAMKSGVPLITTKDSSINEIAGDAVLYADKEIKDLGEIMMQLYKDEVRRSQLIEKGIEVAKNFTPEKMANQLWQSIMKALN